MNKIFGIGLMVVGVGAMVYGAVKMKKTIKQQDEEFNKFKNALNSEMDRMEKEVKEMLKKHATFEEELTKEAK